MNPLLSCYLMRGLMSPHGVGVLAEPLYVARATVRKLGSLHRRVTLALGATADVGVHGAIRDHYRLAPERELPLPVDYIAAATGG